MNPPRAFPDRISLVQARTWQPRAKHSTDLALAAVQIRHGYQNSHGRDSAFVPCLVPSPSPFHARTPVCHDAHTPHHYTRTGGCGFPHTNRHFSIIPLSHTRGLCYTRGFFHTSCFSHTPFHSHSSFHSCAPFHSHTRFLLHTAFHPHYARVSARILPHS